MSNPIKEFPDVSNKLAAPTKKSLFERQKAEAEAKRARDAAETAAVYEDFVKSFEDEEDDDALSKLGARMGNSGPPMGEGTRGGFGGQGGGPKRHFAPSGPKSMNSGPGSLGPPPASLGTKRGFDGSQRERDRDRDHGIFGFDDRPSGGMDASTAFHALDDEDERVSESKAAERAAPKPTLQLTQLPPGTSQAVIKALIPMNLSVEGVRVLPPSGPGSTERKSMTAIVTLAKDTPASDIDTAVSALQNRYLGYGYYLNLSRHLSSAALGGSISAINPSASSLSLPFGARSTYAGPGGPLNRAPPPGGLRGNFAPPASYDGQLNRGLNPVQVELKPPPDIRQLKLIHKTVEALLSLGPEFEALLMSRTDVQQDEKWAWIWDPRSTGGVWYRWRLWQILSGSGSGNNADRYADGSERLFDIGAPWQPPAKDEGLKFEFTTKFDEFISDSEYDSSDEEDSDDDGRRGRPRDRGGPPPEAIVSGQEAEKAYLNPLQKAKLVHLLARLPTTIAKLRKGDVAQVTAFAISHAGAGADEVVNMIISNVEKPFSWSSANPDRKADEDGVDQFGDGDEPEKEVKEDQSSSKLVALYLVSDILSSSSTSGVRHAWRYRQLFETALRERKIFENLGRLEKELQWGRLRAEKWKRSVNSVLALWEGWCVFPQKTQEGFAAMFNNPPLTEEERKAEAEKEKEKEQRESMAKSKWRNVEAGVREGDASPEDVDGEAMEEDVDGEPMMEDLDGEPMEDEDLDGEPMVEDDFHGEPMADDDVDGEPIEASDELPNAEQDSKETATEDSLSNAARARRQRPRAVDMFADSDEE